MLRDQEPDRNMDEPTDTEIHNAIQYLETDSQGSNEQDNRAALAIAITFLILLSGAIGFLWYQWIH
jgi:hypothetical protein